MKSLRIIKSLRGHANVPVFLVVENFSCSRRRPCPRCRGRLRQEHGDLDKLVSVQGQVMLGETPLTTGVVIFRPDASRGNSSQHEPRGQLDAKGHYHLRTGEKEGAAPGWYKVAIIAARPSTDPKNPYAPPQSLIPTIYNDPDNSGLDREVEKNPAPGAYDLQIHQ